MLNSFWRQVESSQRQVWNHIKSRWTIAGGITPTIDRRSKINLESADDGDWKLCLSATERSHEFFAEACFSKQKFHVSEAKNSNKMQPKKIV